MKIFRISLLLLSKVFSAKIISKLQFDNHLFLLNFTNSDLFELDLPLILKGSIAILSNALILKENMILLIDDDSIYKVNIDRIRTVEGIIAPNTFEFKPLNDIKYFTTSPAIVAKIKEFSNTLIDEVTIDLSNELPRPHRNVYLLALIFTTFSISFICFWLFSGIFFCSNRQQRLPLHNILTKLPQIICLLSFVNYYRITFNKSSLDGVALFSFILIACFYKSFLFGIIASIAHGWQILYFSDSRLNFKLLVGIAFAFDLVIEVTVWTATAYPSSVIGYFTLLGRNILEYTSLMAYVIASTYSLGKQLTRLIKHDISKTSTLMPSLNLKQKYFRSLLCFTIGYCCCRMLFPLMHWLAFPESSIIMEKINEVFLEALLTLIMLWLFRQREYPREYFIEIIIPAFPIVMTITIPYGFKGVNQIEETDLQLNGASRKETPFVILHPAIWKEDIKRQQVINCLSLGYAIDYE